MRLKVPKSLYNHLLNSLSFHQSIRLDYHGAGHVSYLGPYGRVEIVSIADEEFCEKVTKEVLQYREEA